MFQTDELIDWQHFARAREVLGHNFWQTLTYLRDEGGQCIAQIEDALRHHDAAAMIGPAERLKAEAMQLGAARLAGLAEHVELEARDCIEWHQVPDILLEAVIALHTAFADTVSRLQEEASPLMVREKTKPPILLGALA